MKWLFPYSFYFHNCFLWSMLYTQRIQLPFSWLPVTAVVKLSCKRAPSSHHISACFGGVMDQENHPDNFYTTVETEPKWVQDKGWGSFPLRLVRWGNLAKMYKHYYIWKILRGLVPDLLVVHFNRCLILTLFYLANNLTNGFFLCIAPSDHYPAYTSVVLIQLSLLVPFLQILSFLE